MDHQLTPAWINAGDFTIEVRMNQEKPVRVLLVEDSAPVRRRIRSLIEESGAVEIVGEAGTLAASRVLFREREPQAVVLDLQLEDGTSYDLLLEIKRTRPACVVIVLTSFPMPECRRCCLESGADYFFDKSREFERVPEVLAELRRSPRSQLSNRKSDCR